MRLLVRGRRPLPDRLHLRQADGVCHRDDSQGTCDIPSQIDAGRCGADGSGDAGADGSDDAGDGS